jgi:hypothetical protein
MVKVFQPSPGFKESEMLNTTFTKLKETEGSAGVYKKLAKYLGPIGKYGKNTPIPLDNVLESVGLTETIWTMRCTVEPPFELLLEFACRCAEHVLPVYEGKYPEDKRVRGAIKAARKWFVTDKTDYPKYEADTTHSAHSATHATYIAFAAHETKVATAAWAAHITADIAADNAHGYQYHADAEHVALMASSVLYATYANWTLSAAEIKWQTKTLRELLRK